MALFRHSTRHLHTNSKRNFLVWFCRHAFSLSLLVFNVNKTEFLLKQTITQPDRTMVYSPRILSTYCIRFGWHSYGTRIRIYTRWCVTKLIISIEIWMPNKRCAFWVKNMREWTTKAETKQQQQHEHKTREASKQINWCMRWVWCSEPR